MVRRLVGVQERTGPPMTAKKKPTETAPATSEKPQAEAGETTTNTAGDIGGFAALQAKADQETARGYAAGSKEEK